MTERLLAILSTLRPSRKLVVAGVELAGLAAISYGASLFALAAGFIVAGIGLILEAYALERR